MKLFHKCFIIFKYLWSLWKNSNFAGWSYEKSVFYWKWTYVNRSW